MSTTVLFIRGQNKKLPVKRAYDDFKVDMNKNWQEREYTTENGKRITIRRSDVQAYYEPDATQPVSKWRATDEIELQGNQLVERERNKKP